MADLSTLQRKNVSYIYIAIYFTHTHTKNPTTKKSEANQGYSKCTSNENTALMCICVMEAKNSSLNKKKRSQTSPMNKSHRHQPTVPHSQPPCLYFTGPISLKAKNTIRVGSSQTLKSHFTILPAPLKAYRDAVICWSPFPPTLCTKILKATPNTI